MRGNKFSLLLPILFIFALFSTKAGALLIAAPLEYSTRPIAAPINKEAQAIVVIGNADSRLRHAANLYHQTQLPVLASGGSNDTDNRPEAALMEHRLRDEFATPVTWKEDRSKNTEENARFSANILKRAGVHCIILVTDAIHMPRSQRIFEKNGLQVIAAPTMFRIRKRFTIDDFLPSAEGFTRTHAAMHEWIGIVWYRVRY